jgi:glycosyltransferase involved in cell wall biosynthesis
MAWFPLVLLRQRPAIVHIHTAQFLVFWETAYYVLVTQLFRLPCILQFHASFRRFYEASGPWLRAAIRWIMRRATVFVVICTEDKAYITQKIKDGLPCVYLPNFINVRIFQLEVELARERIGKSQEVTLLFLGGSESIHKGLFELLEAMRRLAIPPLQLRFLLVAVPQEEVMHRLPADLLARCDVQGWVSGSAKACIFAEADFFVLPSYGEGMPIGILEAMAASMPVIATRVGGILDLITEDQEGYLLDPGDVEGLAQAISRLACDAKTREEMGRKGLETALGM